MSKEIFIVTAALPYANGPLHLGHMLEYIQADIFVRFLRLKNKQVIFCCADDTHGTPIEINAMKANMKPSEFIKIWYKKHVSDIKKFMISFDSYYTTHSKENKKFSDMFFLTLREKGYIYTKPIKHLYCPKCKRYLPDRFVKGICPVCKAEEQYGDICEKCGASYRATELIEPKCVLCNSKPVLKETLHYFLQNLLFLLFFSHIQTLVYR